MGVILWPAYLTLAAAVLRDTWKLDYVETTPSRELAAAGPRRPQPTRAPVPRSIVAVWAALPLFGLGIAIGWTVTGRTIHGLIGIGASLAALVLAFRWLLRD